MKRKPNPQKADRENPAWTKETFARARKARDVLPEIFGTGTAAKMLKPRGLSAVAAGDIGALEGHGSWLANTDGRSIVESCRSARRSVILRLGLDRRHGFDLILWRPLGENQVEFDCRALLPALS
jgi:hypothetical protein